LFINNQRVRDIYRAKHLTSQRIDMTESGVQDTTMAHASTMVFQWGSGQW
jgi:hypothetical protein